MKLGMNNASDRRGATDKSPLGTSSILRYGAKSRFALTLRDIYPWMRRVPRWPRWTLSGRLGWRPLIILIFWLLHTTAHTATLDQILDTIQSKYQHLTTLSARFTQTTKLELLGKTVTSTGTLQLKKPGKMRIEYDDARGKTYISNGKTLWVVDKATQQTDTFKIGSSAVPKEALTFLNGFGNIRESYGVNTATANKDGTTTLRLVPMTATSYTALDGAFRRDGVLQKLVIHNRSGNISRYTFTEIQENPIVPDSQFENTR